MRFIVDENIGPNVARWLREQEHDVFSVYEHARGSDDATILGKAFEENRILITNDKDFGEKIFREKLKHKGVILLRLEDEQSIAKISALENILANYADRLENHFTVVTDTKIRISST